MDDKQPQIFDVLVAIISIALVAVLAIAVTHQIEEEKSRKPHGL